MCKLCTILRIAAKNTLIFSVAAIFIAIFTGFKGIVSNENMLNDIKNISSEPHPIGSEEIDKVKNYIKNAMESEGYKTTEQIFYYSKKLNEQALQNRNNTESYLKDAFTNSKSAQKGVNVICSKDEKSLTKTLILSAHYDSYSTSPGANDNGSGTAIILEIAKHLKATKLPFQIKYVFFSGEEEWFIGSRYFVGNMSLQEKRNLVGVINVDSVAGADGADSSNYWVMVANGKEVVTENDVIDYIPVANQISELFTDSIQFQLVNQMNSDHYPFALIGIPAVTITQDLSNITYINTDKDTIDTIEPSKLSEISNKITDAIKHLGQITKE